MYYLKIRTSFTLYLQYTKKMKTQQMFQYKLSNFIPEYLFAVLGVTWLAEIEPILNFLLLLSGAILGVWKLYDRVLEHRKNKKK